MKHVTDESLETSSPFCDLQWNVENYLKKSLTSAHSKHVLILGVGFTKTSDLQRWKIKNQLT